MLHVGQLNEMTPVLLVFDVRNLVTGYQQPLFAKAEEVFQVAALLIGPMNLKQAILLRSPISLHNLILSIAQ